MKIFSNCVLASGLFGLCMLVGCGGKQTSNESPNNPPPSKTATDQTDNNSPSKVEPKTDDPARPSRSTPDRATGASSSTNGNTAKPATGLRDLLSKLARHDGTDWVIDSNAKDEVMAIERDTTDELLQMMADSSVDVRRGAAYLTLERLNPANSQMVDAFRRALEDDDQTVRHLGLTAFKRMPTEIATSAAKPLGELIRRADETPANRSDIARLLGKMGAEAADALPALIQVAREDPASSVRKTSLAAVARIAAPDEAVPLFRQVLKSETDAALRRLAAGQLKLLGAAAAPAAGDLADTLDDSDEDLRLAARDALISIGAPSVEPLIGKLKSKNARTRALAVFALGSLGSVAKPALPALKDRILDEDEEVRELVEQVILVIQSSP